MRKFLLAFLVVSMIVFGCNLLGDDQSGFTYTSNINSQEFEIDTERDTLLMAANGTVLRIAAGTLMAASGTKAQIVVKEALSIGDMVRGGLTTTAGTTALASGGMIFIDGKDGTQLQGKIEVSLPSTHISSKMQLYKGVEDSDGKVDWQNPLPLPETAASETIRAIDMGRDAFIQKCGTCHGIGKDGTGPDLAHFSRRFSLGSEGVHIYYDHYLDAFKSSDADHHYAFLVYRCNLHRMFGSLGTPIRPTSKEESDTLLAIYKYIQTESDRLNLPLPWQSKLSDCADSCAVYKSKMRIAQAARTMKEEELKSLLEYQVPLLVEERSFELPVVFNNNPGNLQDLVSLQNPTTTYYQFSIESFGWYNIDMLYNELDNLTESKLRVRLANGENSFAVYLIIPEYNVLQQAGSLKTAGEYGFYDRDGSLPLPANTTAWLLAVQDGKDDPLYALQRLDIGENGIDETVELVTKSISKAAFNQLMKDRSWDGLNIRVDDAPYADSIRARTEELKKLEFSVSEIEKLKPVGCDCECLPNVADSTRAGPSVNAS